MVAPTKVIVSFSGGMDSTTLVARCKKAFDEVETVSFDYGSKHNSYERTALERLVEHYHLRHTYLQLELPEWGFKSALLKDGGDIPEGHYEDPSMKVTVVPGRNLIFASILAGLAESRGAKCIALKVHAGDRAVYPDCRSEFIDSLKNTVSLSTENRVFVYTPYLTHSKADIIKEGFRLNVPYHLTRTCYKDQLHACGKCGSCVERREAFSLAGKVDPVIYEK